MFCEGDVPVPGYKLVAFLGRGQFGDVWRAISPGGTQAALKLIDLNRASGLKELRGIQLLKKIRHPHLMPITAMWLLDRNGHVLTDDLFEALAAANQPAADARATMVPDAPAIDETLRPTYLIVAMLLADKGLDDLLKEYREQGEEGIPCDKLIGYMTEAAKAIDHLNSPIHDLGHGPTAIQHCDIKPANIMLTGDSVMICDFGLARNFSGLQNVVAATSLVGSPAYMPPECIERKPSRSTDQYSLAISYCELRTGRLPFHSEEYMAVLDAHRSGDLDLSGLTAAERQVIRKATAVSPDDRYDSTQTMVTALRQAALGADTPASSSRGPALLIVLVAVAALSAIGWLGRDWWLPGPDHTGNGGGGHDVPVPVAKVKVRLQVVPHDASVYLADKLLATDPQGWVAAEVEKDGKFEVMVERAEYERVQAQYTTADLLAGITIELERAESWLAAQVDLALDRGEWSDALEKYRELVQRDAGQYAVIPAAKWVLDGHTKAVRHLKIDGSAMFSGGDDGQVFRWNLSVDAPPESLPVHQHASMVEEIVGVGDNVASVDVGGTLLCTTPQGTQELSRDATTVTISADQVWLAAGGFEGGLEGWRLSNLENTKIAAPKAHDLAVRGLAIVKGPFRLVSVGEDDRVRAWTPDEAITETGSPGPLVSAEGDITRIVVARTRALVAFGGELKDTSVSQPWYVIYTWELSGEPTQLDGGHAEAITCLTITDSGRWLASGSSDGVVGLWDMEAPDIKQRPVKAHNQTVRSVAVLPGRGVFFSCGDDKHVCIGELNGMDPSVTKLPTHPGPVFSIVLSADSRWLFTACQDGHIRVWDLPRLLLIREACRAENVPMTPAGDTPPIIRS